MACTAISSRGAEGGGEGEGAPRALDDGQVDELAAKGDRPLAACLRLVEGLHDPLGVVDLFGRGAEGGIDHVDLARVEERLAREAQTAAELAVGGQAVEVADVWPDPVDGLHVGRRGRRDQRRAGVEQLARLALAPGRQAQLQAEVLRPEHQRGHAPAGGGDRVGVQEAAGALDGHDVAQAAELDPRRALALEHQAVDQLDLLGGLHLGQRQPIQAWLDDGVEVRLEALAADGIDPHVAEGPSHPRPAQRLGDQDAAGGFLGRRDPVLEVEHEHVGGQARERLVEEALRVPRYEHPRAHEFHGVLQVLSPESWVLSERLTLRTQD